jgi:hypothetical protein
MKNPLGVGAGGEAGLVPEADLRPRRGADLEEARGTPLLCSPSVQIDGVTRKVPAARLPCCPPVQDGPACRRVGAEAAILLVALPSGFVQVRGQLRAQSAGEASPDAAPASVRIFSRRGRRADAIRHEAVKVPRPWDWPSERTPKARCH